MRRTIWAGMLSFFAMVAVMCAVQAADLTEGLQTGEISLGSAGPLAFGPEGILFVGDPKNATVIAIATDDTSGKPDEAKYNVEKVDQKIAAALGTETKDILINDMAVNPASGNVYLSVSRGAGPDATAVLLRVDPKGQLTEVD